jgi:hypothetical protein
VVVVAGAGAMLRGRGLCRRRDWAVAGSRYAVSGRGLVLPRLGWGEAAIRCADSAEGLAVLPQQGSGEVVTRCVASVPGRPAVSRLGLGVAGSLCVACGWAVPAQPRRSGGS